MKRNPKAWRRWYDPDATPQDYERWKAEHAARVRARIETYMAEALGNAVAAGELAHRSGLSLSTVRRYLARRTGKRGPLLSTFIAFKHRDRV